MTDQPKIGDLIDTLARLRAKKKEVTDIVSRINARINDLQYQLTEQLERAGLDGAKGEQASVSLKREIVPVVHDWGKANPWILRHGELQLFQKRLSPKHYRDLLQTYKRGIPGISDHENVTLNFKSL